MKRNFIKNLIILCVISVCFSTSCSSKDNLDPKKTEAISKKLNISNADAKKLYELMLESRAITDADTNITEEEIGTRAKELTDKVTKLLNLSSPLEALLTIGTVSDIIFDSTGTKDTSENLSPTSNYTDTQINDMINHWTNLCYKNTTWTDEEKQQMIDFYTNGIKETPDTYWKLYSLRLKYEN